MPTVLAHHAQAMPKRPRKPKQKDKRPWLREACRQPGKSQSGLAKAAGTTESRVSEWISGKTKAIPSKLWQGIANYLGWSWERVARLETGGEPPIEAPQAELCTFARTLSDDQARRGLTMLHQAFMPEQPERKKATR